MGSSSFALAAGLALWLVLFLIFGPVVLVAALALWLALVALGIAWS